jgi:hypothetical protein
MTAFWDIAPCSRRFRDESIIRAIVLMMEAVRISETSINFYETVLCDLPKGCHLHTRCSENLKFYSKILFSNCSSKRIVYTSPGQEVDRGQPVDRETILGVLLQARG